MSSFDLASAISIICFVPRDLPSQNAITLSARASILRVRIGPAPYCFQSGVHTCTAMPLLAAHDSKRSIPAACFVSEKKWTPFFRRTSSVAAEQRCVQASTPTCARVVRRGCHGRNLVYHISWLRCSHRAQSCHQRNYVCQRRRRCRHRRIRRHLTRRSRQYLCIDRLCFDHSRAVVF